MKTGMVPATRGGIAGEEIPLLARIVALIDTYEGDQPGRAAGEKSPAENAKRKGKEVRSPGWWIFFLELFRGWEKV